MSGDSQRVSAHARHDSCVCVSGSTIDVCHASAQPNKTRLRTRAARTQGRYSVDLKIKWLISSNQGDIEPHYNSTGFTCLYTYHNKVDKRFLARFSMFELAAARRPIKSHVNFLDFCSPLGCACARWPRCE